MGISSIYRCMPFLFIIVAFGPYIHTGLGLRLEHIIIYPLFLILMLVLLLKKKVFIKDLFVLFSIWLSALTLITIRTVLGEDASFIQYLPDLESMIQPLVIILLFSIIFVNFSQNEAENRLIKACKILITMMSLNTVWSIISMFVDLTPISMYFWGGAEDSVSARAMTNGRFNGIFNQPMEAGVLYSLGLLCWIYLSEKINIFKFKYTISLILMIVGGLLTVSKIFLFGGIGLFFIGVLSNKKIWKLIFSLTFTGLIIGVPAFYFLTKTWTGLDYLLRFFGSNQDIITLLTAGRFGEQSQQAQLFGEVWNENPLIGGGLGVHEVYDSGFFYFFGTGGTIGLMFYIILLLTFVGMALKYFIYNKRGSESKFFFLITLLIIGSSLGAPVLTLNRVATVLWVFIGLIIHYFYFSIVKEPVSEEEVEVDTEIQAKKKKRFKKYKIVW